MDDALKRLEQYVERVILSPEDRASMLKSLANKQHLPLDVAAEMANLPAELLRKLVRSGVIRGEAPYRTKGVVGWCDIVQALEIASQLHLARQSVEGRSISVLDAEAKYGIPNPTLYRWLQRGTIRSIGRSSDGALMLDEGEIAMARAVSDLLGKGKAMFY